MAFAKTLGELKKQGYVPKSIKQELRDNLIDNLKNKKPVFKGIYGFDDTVIPDMERAILSKHNILLLGLRGQAKTRIARLMVELLDEYVPIIEGSELNDDPMMPLSVFGHKLVDEMGDATPIQWLHRSERYVEKLATPDVSVADLIGDVDPIKAASLKLPYSDERVIHFGLIPRSHRCIFVINEIPDLQARIQVSLFNILQEGDIQIRGFKTRLPLDIQFVFTANPEDYTNRGSIITPLKDRIESQILTHYPENIETSKAITQQEAMIARRQSENVTVPDVLKNILERIAIAARKSEFVDEKSGVSARMSITAMENLYSTAERRAIINGEKKTIARIADFWGVIPSITGKVELVYEGEVEGQYNVALQLLSQAIREEFLETFPHPEKIKKGKEKDPYGAIRAYFGDSNIVTLPNDVDDDIFYGILDSVPGLDRLLEAYKIPKSSYPVYKEIVLHSLSDLDVLTKELTQGKIAFSDPLGKMLNDLDEEDRD
ncbi:MAG TPA: sigma 54-interacting transcriptional regulator [Saprospiraceae bacterium]|nr:sigma 54-interacting transcriptional regulator [Saprospiraceae bacterium]